MILSNFLVPQKKRFLQKWIDSCSQLQPTVVSPTSLTPPPSSSSSPSRSSQVEIKTIVDMISEPIILINAELEPNKPDLVAAAKLIKPHPPKVTDDVLHSSSLFDDFSDDDDFEDISDRGRNGDAKRERLQKLHEEFKMDDVIETTPLYPDEQLEKVSDNSSEVLYGVHVCNMYVSKMCYKR